jgi:hypothetical protein
MVVGDFVEEEVSKKCGQIVDSPRERSVGEKGFKKGDGS